MQLCAFLPISMYSGVCKSAWEACRGSEQLHQQPNESSGRIIFELSCILVGNLGITALQVTFLQSAKPGWTTTSCSIQLGLPENLKVYILRSIWLHDYLSFIGWGHKWNSIFHYDRLHNLVRFCTSASVSNPTLKLVSLQNNKLFGQRLEAAVFELNNAFTTFSLIFFFSFDTNERRMGQSKSIVIPIFRSHRHNYGFPRVGWVKSQAAPSKSSTLPKVPHAWY